MVNDMGYKITIFVALIYSIAGVQPSSDTWATAQFVCHQAGSFADPEDCSKFYVCDYNEAGDLTATSVSCAADTVWCQGSLECDSPLTCPCWTTGQTTEPTDAPPITDPTDQSTASQTEEEPTTIPVSTTTEPPAKRPKNCLEIQMAGNPDDLTNAEPYDIYPFGPGGASISVRCDFETDGGGWTLIQRRFGGPKEEFYLDWADYEGGFGSAMANYWIGLHPLYFLTSGEPQALRVDLGDWEGNYAYASYTTFSVAVPSDFYRLSVGGYSGTAGDSLMYQNGMRFTTRDKDNDNDSSNCAQVYYGAWWYAHCHHSNLNGLYWNQGEAVPFGVGVTWYHWKGFYYSLKVTEMKIRDASFSSN